MYFILETHLLTFSWFRSCFVPNCNVSFVDVVRTLTGTIDTLFPCCLEVVPHRCCSPHYRKSEFQLETHLFTSPWFRSCFVPNCNVWILLFCRCSVSSDWNHRHVISMLLEVAPHIIASLNSNWKLICLPLRGLEFILGQTATSGHYSLVDAVRALSGTIDTLFPCCLEVALYGRCSPSPSSNWKLLLTPEQFGSRPVPNSSRSHDVGFNWEDFHRLPLVVRNRAPRGDVFLALSEAMHVLARIKSDLSAVTLVSTLRRCISPGTIGRAIKTVYHSSYVRDFSL